MKQKILLSWSGGKDSALALQHLQNNGNIEIIALLTTVTEDYDRISLHGVRSELLVQQAKCLGYPLEKVTISKTTSNEEYDSKMQEILEKYLALGVSTVVFGDIFLEDVRKYREENLSKIGMKGIFPLWGRDTTELANMFINSGFKAIVTCVDSNILPKEFVGRVIDKQFLSDLPSNVDPSGENGEFHSFVYDGPIFKNKIFYRIGNVVLRDDRFYFCDLLTV